MREAAKGHLYTEEENTKSYVTSPQMNSQIELNSLWKSQYIDGIVQERRNVQKFVVIWLPEME